MNLSKSKYCNGFQCKKMLWLDKYKPVEKTDLNNDSVFDNGTDVGIVAKGIFGDYIDIDFNTDLSKMIESTLETINNNEICNITEASFSYNNNFCSVDILRKNRNEFEIYEVKSSTEVKDIYKEDASYQYYVMTKLGYNVKKVCIVYINNKYKRHGDLELNKLFNIEDITDIAVCKVDAVEKRIKDINDYMEMKEEPQDGIGLHCFNPYECPFFSYCTKDLDKPNVFDIVKMNKNQKFKLFNNGKVSFKELLSEDLNERFREQIDFEINDREDKIEVDKIEEFLDTLSYPLYFLDFETYQQVIPLYDDIMPYEQIPFQYSLHYIESKGGKLYHKEFLAEADIDSRRGLAERLVEDIPKDVCVLAYNMGFEKSVIKHLAVLYPDLSEHLLNIASNLKDLMIPFFNRNYYTKNMKGSYSIKYVLPALFPDDPSLNYHNLEGVHNGSEAMNAYASLGSLSKVEQEILRNNLLKYCELDTFAMVKIYYKLLEVTNKK